MRQRGRSAATAASTANAHDRGTDVAAQAAAAAAAVAATWTRKRRLTRLGRGDPDAARSAKVSRERSQDSMADMPGGACPPAHRGPLTAAGLARENSTLVPASSPHGRRPCAAARPPQSTDWEALRRGPPAIPSRSGAAHCHGPNQHPLAGDSEGRRHTATARQHPARCSSRQAGPASSTPGP